MQDATPVPCIRELMNKFKKLSPTKIIFGENKLKELPDLLPKDCKRVLIVTGCSSSKINNSLSRIESLLKIAGKEYFIFDRVEQNPSAKTINLGAALARKQRIDTVIGLGGGSPMDSAKCIAILANNAGLIEDYLKDISPKNFPAFLIEIPTTAGSGSEVNQHAVISMATKKGVSHTYHFPKVAILDPLLTMTMPHEITVNTGVDALTHAIEGYLSTSSTPETDELALESIKIIKITLPELAIKINEEPQNPPPGGSGPLTRSNYLPILSSRTKMLYASMLGGLIIAKTGTIILHALGYSLTVFYNVPHGRANGALLPVVLDFVRDIQGEKIDKIFQIFDKTTLQEFLSDLGISTNIKDYGVSYADIPKFVKDVLGRRNLNYTPKEVTEKDISELYTKAL